jgi:hypothetical protein
MISTASTNNFDSNFGDQILKAGGRDADPCRPDDLDADFALWKNNKAKTAKKGISKYGFRYVMAGRAVSCRQRNNRADSRSTVDS